MPRLFLGCILNALRLHLFFRKQRHKFVKLGNIPDQINAEIQLLYCIRAVSYRHFKQYFAEHGILRFFLLRIALRYFLKPFFGIRIRICILIKLFYTLRKRFIVLFAAKILQKTVKQFSFALICLLDYLVKCLIGKHIRLAFVEHTKIGRDFQPMEIILDKRVEILVHCANFGKRQHCLLTLEENVCRVLCDFLFERNAEPLAHLIGSRPCKRYN